MTNILQDGYNRRVNYLRISVTERCNMRCVYCMPEEGIAQCGHTDVLTYEEILQVVDSALNFGIDRFRITGGEPLVRKGIVEFIEKLAQKPGVRDIAMTTNGVLLEEFAPKLKAAGLNRVNISLDSLNEENFYRITRTRFLQKVLGGIDAALENGLDPVKINMVIMKENIDEIGDFVKLAQIKNVHVRFIEFMPIGDGQKWADDGYIPLKRIQDDLMRTSNIAATEDIEGGGPARYFKSPGALGTVGFIAPISDHFCDSCNRLRLTSDGKLRACLTLNSEIDVKRIIRAGLGQEALNESFREILAMKPCRHDMETGLVQRLNRRMSEIGG